MVPSRCILHNIQRAGGVASATQILDALRLPPRAPSARPRRPRSG